MFDKSQIRLKKGYTINDYIIKRNEGMASYDTICKELKIKIDEARAIYDRIYNIPLSAIGTRRREPSMMCASPKPPTLVCLKTGTNWRKSNECAR